MRAQAPVRPDHHLPCPRALPVTSSAEARATVLGTLAAAQRSGPGRWRHVVGAPGAGRRHSTAVDDNFACIASGSVPVDLDLIPAPAIERRCDGAFCDARLAYDW